MEWLSFFAGLFCGVFVGVMTMALVQVSGKE